MPSKPRHLLVGVTGGIGSGKSTVCTLFEKLGRTVFRADEIAREISDHDQNVRRDIIALLGTRAYPDGEMDRKFVARLVFKDPALRKKLEAIIHPAVFSEIDARIARLPERQRSPYVIIEAALIFEAGMDDRLDYTVVVDAAEETRIERVMQREGCPREDVTGRMKAQISTSARLAKADFVIKNDQNESFLAEKVRFIDSLLIRLLPPKPTTKD